MNPAAGILLDDLSASLFHPELAVALTAVTPNCAEGEAQGAANAIAMTSALFRMALRMKSISI